MATQQKRLRDIKIRAYQTYFIFRKARLAERGLKWLTFLGIAVPLLVGGIVTTIYTENKPPAALLAAAGMIGLLQGIVSVWALVDKWDEKARLSAETLHKSRELHIELEKFYPDPSTGKYDDSKLNAFEGRSYLGHSPDDSVGIRQAERDAARKIAEKRFK